MIGILDALSPDQARAVVQIFKAAFSQGPAKDALEILRKHFSARTSMNRDTHQVTFLEGQRFVILTIDHLRDFDERVLTPAPVDALISEEESHG